MSLFSTQQISDISLEYAIYPDLRQVQVDALASLNDSKQAAIDLDAQNEIFTDLYRNVAESYHRELELLGQQTRTALVSNAAIEAGGEAFFPTSPVWANLQPKLQDSNNGDPRSAFGGQTEAQEYNKFLQDIDYLRNGRVSAVSTTLSADYEVGNPSIQVSSTSGFSSGQIIQVGTADFLYATIDSIVGSDIFITAIGEPQATISSGETVGLSFSGFTEAERTLVSPPINSRLDLMNYLQGLIDTAVAAQETFYTVTHKPILEGNADVKNAADVTAEIAVIDGLILVLNNFSGSTPTVRFGDLVLNQVESTFSSRASTGAPARAGAIDTALGSVSQAGDGSFSGAGVYFDFYEWQDKRMNIGSGSIPAQGGLAVAISAVQSKIDALDSNRSEQEIYFTIQPFTADAVNAIVVVNDVSGFSVSDDVFVFAEGQTPVETTIIDTDPIGSTIELAVPLGPDFTVGNVGRIVKALA